MSSFVGPNVRNLHRLGRHLLLGGALLASSAALAQDSVADGSMPVAEEPDYSLEAVVTQMRRSRAEDQARLEAREQRYEQRFEAAQQRLVQARKTLQQRESEGHQLDRRFESNKVELNDKAALLKDKIGALKELFGVFQQNASDLIGAFTTSPTSIEYPDRDIWLEGFANRMKDASEVSSADDIKHLWFELLREISATDDIVRVTTPVRDIEGNVSSREVVRVGTFNLLTDEPVPGYLVWSAGKQQPVELKRQPEGPYRSQIDAYLNGNAALSTLSVDPTGGALLTLLIEKPTLRERIDQGGLVGYMILSLGAVALVLALLKLLDITLISVRVALQQRRIEAPVAGNPLGRLIQVWQQNRHVDSETLEMRLHDCVQKESGRVNRFTIFLAIIAAVAPLMGLLGTVVGMINTFQAITLYGTGDPQTMAGGISQALITTVLGLVVAVPAVLLHAVVSARGRAVVNLLKQFSASLAGDSLEIERQGTAQADSLYAVPEPTS